MLFPINTLNYPYVAGNNAFQRIYFGAADPQLANLKKSLAAVTKNVLGKEWKPDDKILGLILDEYAVYPERDQVNLTDLNNPSGKAFLREALILAIQFSDKLTFNSPEIDKMEPIWRGLCAKEQAEVRLLNIHKRVWTIMDELYQAKNSPAIISIAKTKASKNRLMWTHWQQIGETMFRKNHKLIYEKWPVSMQELSDVHRDVEALCHLLETANHQGVNTNQLAQAIKEHVQNMVRVGTLKKLSEAPQNLTRSDIPNSINDYHQQWRGMRTAAGARDTQVVAALKQKHRF